MATLNHAAVHPPPYTSDSSTVLVSDSSVTSLTSASALEYVELPAREVFPELDPNFEPTYRKFRAISIAISIVLIFRVLILGFLCFPWALKSFLNFPNGYVEDFILYEQVDIESFIIPEELRDETMFRYVLACVFAIDLGVCVSTSIIGLFVRDIAWSSFLCILWVCFILITFVIYLLGVFMFLLNNRYFNIFYADMILLPTLTVLLIYAIRCLRTWGTKGYKRFVQPYKVVTDEKPPDSKKQETQDTVPAAKMQTHTAQPVVMPQPHSYQHPQTQQNPHHHHPSISFHPVSKPIPNAYSDYNDNDRYGPRKSVTPSSANLVSKQASIIFKQDAASSSNIFKQDAARLFRDDAMLAERRKSRILEDDNARLERRKSRILEDDDARLERRKSRARDESDDYRYERRKSRARDDSESSRDKRRKSRARDDSDSSRDKRRRKSRARSEDHHRKDRRKSRTEKSKKSKHHRK